MSWLLLALACASEVLWACSMKLSEGFSRPLPSLIAVVCTAATFVFLTYALKHLPLGAAYLIFIGAGAVGTFALGVLVFAEPLNPMRLGSVALILLGILALKLS